MCDFHFVKPLPEPFNLSPSPLFYHNSAPCCFTPLLFVLCNNSIFRLPSGVTRKQNETRAFHLPLTSEKLSWDLRTKLKKRKKNVSHVPHVLQKITQNCNFPWRDETLISPLSLPNQTLTTCFDFRRLFSRALVAIIVACIRANKLHASRAIFALFNGAARRKTCCVSLHMWHACFIYSWLHLINSALFRTC